MKADAVIGVLLVEDHAVVRQGLRALLERVPDIEVVGESADLAGLGVLSVDPDVVVTDLSLPDSADAATVNGVRAALPDAAVLVLSMLDELETVEACLRAGAVGYVVKDAAATELVSAIRAVAHQGAYLPPDLGAALVRRRHEEATDLTSRQREVLRLLALGHTNADVAATLGLSTRTVEATRAELHAVVGGRTRVELVRYALAHGILRAD